MENKLNAMINTVETTINGLKKIQELLETTNDLDKEALKKIAKYMAE